MSAYRGLCPYCGRTVNVDAAHRFYRHSVAVRGFELCPLSGLPIPVQGLSHLELKRRAHLVGSLAVQLRDEDPTLLWTYLTCLDATEVQRLLMIALAAIPVDKCSISELFDWTCWLTTKPDGPERVSA